MARLTSSVTVHGLGGQKENGGRLPVLILRRPLFPSVLRGVGICGEEQPTTYRITTAGSSVRTARNGFLAPCRKKTPRRSRAASSSGSAARATWARLFDHRGLSPQMGGPRPADQGQAHLSAIAALKLHRIARKSGFRRESWRFTGIYTMPKMSPPLCTV